MYNFVIKLRCTSLSRIGSTNLWEGVNQLCARVEPLLSNVPDICTVMWHMAVSWHGSGLILIVSCIILTWQWPCPSKDSVSCLWYLAASWWRHQGRVECLASLRHWSRLIVMVISSSSLCAICSQQVGCHWFYPWLTTVCTWWGPNPFHGDWPQVWFRQDSARDVSHILLSWLLSPLTLFIGSFASSALPVFVHIKGWRPLYTNPFKVGDTLYLV